MKSNYEIDLVSKAELGRPRGVVLKGQFVEVLRSEKGKIKGLVVRTDRQDYAIKLPKYLRPVLVCELSPSAFVQVWAYQDEDKWRGINIMPLVDTEAAALREAWADRPQPKPEAETLESPRSLCVQVCTKGKCFKQGGKQILQTLQSAADTNPDLQHVSVKGVGCMKACKKGPNIRLSSSNKVVNGVTPERALSLISKNS
ncbi:(2Fe-2S) ferredoxin domain-containing protein [Oscillatoria sp. CS-180]|uniref:(2Fe-2S) ferredoxin domain-containing protein n=1 Tax=Oscillatoria sp. CS-180 TaxID=3021720 RepID=UPI00233016BC|nr:(2Fe-2S) ferredoxin domain-containing protein [Oscillatoria sp. CS-180]MDB9526564.1 (2Fe-2S) ferredoxin domain-containing protein [Oscillatoria sp. CS-180]